MKNIVCYFDGCCEPCNPGGTIGVGAIVNIDGQKALEHSESFPASKSNTNNIAEYLAFAKVLSFLIKNNLQNESVVIRGDSQMVVNQMSGKWRIKEGGYVTTAKRCEKALIEYFPIKPKIEWIPRDQNDECDRLSKGHLICDGIKIAIR